MKTQQCPWSELKQSKLSFCEEPLCGWVKQPGNTWSNLGFLLVSFVIWKQIAKTQHRMLGWFAFVSTVIGLGSAFYHASGAYFAAVADYSGMFLVTGLMTAMNTRRWLGISSHTTGWLFLATTSVLIALSVLFPESARIIYVLSAPCCLIELRLFFRDKSHVTYRYYLLSWLAVGLGTLAWSLDETKVICDPTNHILSLHAVWHLLMALALYTLFQFYRQFEDGS